MKRKLWIASAFVVVGLIGFYLTRPAENSENLAAQVVTTPISIEGFTRADGSQTVVFPRDFGPHLDYQTEWWYYTGNLDTADGRHFGYELTFFRGALLPPALAPERSSDWATNQIYMAHLALSDVDGDQFYAFQRFARGAAELAGAESNPYRVWLEDWNVEQTGNGVYQLTASNEDIQLELQLTDEKGPVLHGDNGYSQKGPAVGNASYYYSQTRLATQGNIRIGGEAFAVSGLSWKDHEYSTNVLSQGQVGWDWFSIQLDDDYELMLYQIRREDGSIDPFSSGTLIAPDGSTTQLSKEDFVIETHDTWQSPHSDAVYPMGWTLRIPSAELELELSPYMRDQEINLSTIYWEGAVRITGTHNGLQVNGDGYVEMTGYAVAFDGQF